MAKQEYTHEVGLEVFDLGQFYIQAKTDGHSLKAHTP